MNLRSVGLHYCSASTYTELIQRGEHQIFNSLSVRKELFLAVVLAIYCAFDLLTNLAANWGFTTDDAYISWVYARQLVNGNGLQWHLSLPRVEGYSNFLWIMIASLVLKLKLPIVLSIKMISCFSLGAGLFFLYRLGRLFLSPLLSMLPIFIFSHFIGVAWWTVSGLESMFYCSLSVLLVWQCSIAFGYQAVEKVQCNNQIPRLSTSAWVTTNMVLLLLSLTRFEGVIWTIPVLLFTCCQLRSCRDGTVHTESRRIYIWGMISFFCFLLPYTIYFIWRLNYFGSWIPNSYICKALTPGQFFVVDFDYLLIIIPLLVASLPYLFSFKDCRHCLLWVPSVLYVLLLWKANPVITHLLRLFLGPLALFSLLPVLGVTHFLNDFQQKMDPKIVTTGIIMFLTFIFIPGNSPQYLKALLRQYQERTQVRLTVVKILNTQAKKGDTVLFGDCGVVPFTVRDDIRFIDTDCINNSELTHKPYNNNLSLYAEHIANQVKPEWVITTYEPLEFQGNYLFVLLRKIRFFDAYQLVTTLESAWVYGDSPENSEKKIDYRYQVYKRNM